MTPNSSAAHDDDDTRHASMASPMLSEGSMHPLIASCLSPSVSAAAIPSCLIHATGDSFSKACAQKR